MRIIEPRNPSTQDIVKQSKERAFFKTFAAAEHGIVPDGTWEQMDSVGGPDFVLEGGKLGIELTELLRGNDEERGSKFKAQEIMRQRIVENAIQSETFQGFGYRVTAYADLKKEIALNEKPNSVAAITKALTQLLLKHLPGEGMQTINISRDDNQELPKHFTRILIQRLDDGTGAQGYCADCGNAEAAKFDLIQARIDDKNGKVADYTTRTKEQWLLIVIDGAKYSSWLVLTEACLNHVYRSSFARVFVLEEVEQKVHELKLEFLASPSASR